MLELHPLDNFHFIYSQCIKQNDLINVIVKKDNFVSVPWM